jgi:hypothetical protein
MPPDHVPAIPLTLPTRHFGPEMSHDGSSMNGKHLEYASIDRLLDLSFCPHSNNREAS